MAEQKPTMKVELGSVVVRPGDTLVIGVRTGLHLNAERAAALCGRVEDELPGVHVVVVAADQLLVYQPDEAVTDG